MYSEDNKRDVYQDEAYTQTLHLLKRPYTYHIKNIYLLTCDNTTDVVYFSFVLGLAHAYAAPALSLSDQSVSTSQLLLQAPAMLLWPWLNLLLFALHNQSQESSIMEDRINKPWRPIASGRLSISDAKMMLWIAYPIVTFFSFQAGCLGPFFAEALCAVSYNDWNGGANPFWKNWITAVGYVAFMSGPLEIATGKTLFYGGALAFKWHGILVAAMFMTSHCQDFRDTTGDKAAGRRTVPIALGDTPSRLLASSNIVAWTLVSFVFWEIPWIGLALPFLISLYLGHRILMRRTVKDDRRSWKLWAIWVMSLSSMPMVKTYLEA